MIGFLKQIGERRRQRARVSEFESAIDRIERIMAIERQRRESGYVYANRAGLVKAILDRYHGRASYGNVLVRRTVNLLAAYQLGAGVELVVTQPRAAGPDVESRVDKKANGGVVNTEALEQTKAQARSLESVYADELAFARDFFDANNLTEERSQELAREKELTGQVLLLPYWSESDRMVRLRYVAWDETRYRVERDEWGNILFAEWADKDGRMVRKSADEFVFMRWNGRLNGVEGSPTVAGHLWLCDDIERALCDLRGGNKLFGVPTPVFETKTKEETEEVNAGIEKNGWRLGQAIALTGTAKMLEMTGAAAEALEKEVELKIRLFCGGCGINPHFVGWPDLLSNRSTADDMENPVASVAKSDVMVWVGGFEELLAKATVMYNRNMRLRRELTPGAVMAMVVTSTQTEFRELREVWLPLRLAREIDQRTFLSKVPGIKIDQVIAALAAEDASSANMNSGPSPDEIKTRVERMRQERMNAES